MHPIIPSSLSPPGYNRRKSRRKPRRPLIDFEAGNYFEAGNALGVLGAILACLLLTLTGNSGAAHWALAVAFGAFVVGMARSFAQWINSWDDPRHAKRPPDAP